MKIVAYCLFALAGLGTLVAINIVFRGSGTNRPEGFENLVGYAVGAFLVPIVLVIAGLILLNKRRKPSDKNDA